MDISREDAQKKTYIYQLMNDTGCRIEELPIAMEYKDRERWRERVMEYRASRPDDDDDDDDASFFFIIPIKNPFSYFSHVQLSLMATCEPLEKTKNNLYDSWLMLLLY